MLDLKTVVPETFEKYVGQDFMVPGAAGDALPLTLLDVTRRKSSAPSHCRQEPFSLRFRAPKGMQGPQGTYLLRAPDGMEVSVFLVPTGPESNAPMMTPDDHLIFQCVFN